MRNLLFKITIICLSIFVVSCSKEEIIEDTIITEIPKVEVPTLIPQKIYNSSTLNHEWNSGWVTFVTQKIESEFWTGFTYFDYNQDGKMDVFFKGWTPDNSNPIGVNIRTETGWKNIPNVVDFQPGRGYRKIAAADIDNDGDMDMVCFIAEDPGASYGNNNRIMGGLDIYRFDNGKFYYESVVPYQESMKFYFHGGVVGYVNGDGWVDLIGTGTSGGKVYLNDGTGKFSNEYFEVTDVVDTKPSPGTTAFTLELADLNSDGKLDLMVGYSRNAYYFPQNPESEHSKYNYTSSIYFGKSEYPYFETTALVLDSAYAKTTIDEMKYAFNITYDYVVSDMDDDGDLDLFVYLTNDDALYNPGDNNYLKNAALEYHENNGDSTFTLKNNVFVQNQNKFATGPDKFKAWDIDGDGKKEILLEAFDRLPFNAWKQNSNGKYYQTVLNF